MQPWVSLDTARAPDGAKLELARRGDEFAIRVDGVQLMGSRQHGSEDALATLACGRMRPTGPAAVLVGGLGMGFTLAKTLTEVGPDATVTVAELVPEVVRWNREHLGHLSGDPLHDPRVRVVEADVGAVIRDAEGAFDAILLDVDNGPDALTSAGNGRLYTYDGLRAARRALRPGGVLAVWSADPDRAFTQRLKSVGYAVEEPRVRATNAGRGSRHVIWLAVRGANPPTGRRRR